MIFELPNTHVSDANRDKNGRGGVSLQFANENNEVRKRTTAFFQSPRGAGA